MIDPLDFNSFSSSSYGYADYARPQAVQPPSRGGFEPPSFVPRPPPTNQAMDHHRQNGHATDRIYRPETLERPEVLVTTERGLEKSDGGERHSQMQESPENMNRWNSFERHTPERNDTQDTLTYERSERADKAERFVPKEKVDRSRKYEGYSAPEPAGERESERERKRERRERERERERKSVRDSYTVLFKFQSPTLHVLTLVA